MGVLTVLEVVIGLVFIYSLVSLLCSGVNEYLAQQLGRRGKFLREGLTNLISDRWLYLRVINHPIVAVMYRDLPGKPRTPSYIPSHAFVTALLDTLVLKAGQIHEGAADGPPRETPGRPETNQPMTPDRPRDFAEVRAAALRCRAAGYWVADAVLPLLDEAQGDLAKARQNIEQWYEGAMDRVSGWYKRYTMRLLLASGLVVAVLFNVDTIQIVTQLSRSAELRRVVTAAAEDAVATGKLAGVAPAGGAAAPDDMKRLVAGLQALETQGLPVGFSCLTPRALSQTGDSQLLDALRRCWSQARTESGAYWVVKALGWVISALAISLGAPFWFELLNRLVDLRGAGRKPAPTAPGRS